MFEFLYYSDNLTSFILVAVRVGSILAAAPFFGSSMIKGTIKVFLTIIISLLVFHMVEVRPFTNPDFLLLILLIFKEILIGVCIGIISHFLFVGIQVGGQVAGMQMGFGMLRVIDPTTSESGSIITSFLNITMLLFFLGVGGHYLVIGAIAESFNLIPLGGGHIEPLAFEYIVKLFSYIFLTGVKVMAPVLMTLLMFSTILGIIGKFVQQINLMMVGFPIKIAIGLTMLSLSMQYFYVVFEKILHRYFEEVANIIRFF